LDSATEKAAPLFDNDFDVVDIPIEDLRGLSQEEAVAHILSHWDALLANFSKFGILLHQVKSSFSHTLNVMDSKIESVDARLGMCSKRSLSENCITVWDGLSYLDDLVESVSESLTALGAQHAGFHKDTKDSLAAMSTRLDTITSDVGKGLSEV
jgi:hypothetical protein